MDDDVNRGRKYPLLAGVVGGGQAGTTRPVIVCTGLTKCYDPRQPDAVALANIDLAVEPGELVAIMGAAPRRARASRLARLTVRLHLGSPITTGFRDVFGRPLRATLAILTLAVTVLAFVVTLGFERTIDRMASARRAARTEVSTILRTE